MKDAILTVIGWVGDRQRRGVRIYTWRSPQIGNIKC